MEDNIKELLRYSFFQGTSYIPYEELTAREKEILTSIEYYHIIEYLSK